MSIVDYRGVGLGSLARDRRTPLTPEQAIARRNEDWRRDHDEGRVDPVTGRLVPRSVALIAQLSGYSPRTIQAGIADARRILRAIADAN